MPEFTPDSAASPAARTTPRGFRVVAAGRRGYVVQVPQRLSRWQMRLRASQRTNYANYGPVRETAREACSEAFAKALLADDWAGSAEILALDGEARRLDGVPQVGAQGDPYEGEDDEAG